MSESNAPTTHEARTARNIGVGCFTAFVGCTSGAMTSVFFGKMIGFFQRCQPIEGLPACNWHLYAIGGAIVGMVTLPTLVLWRLRRADRVEDGVTQSNLKRG